MRRHAVGAAEARSQKWIQRFVNERPGLLDERIRTAFGWRSTEQIEWLSPLAGDDYADNSDQEFIERLGVAPLKVPLDDFWPRGGPHWDALARTKDTGRVILVEAKAHLAELLSGPSGAGETSMARIKKTLAAVKSDLGSTARADWAEGEFYQAANRIAHLHFLRETNGVDAYLVYVCFVNAPDVPKLGQASEAEWRGALQLSDFYLGLGHHPLKAFKAAVFAAPTELGESIA